MASCDVASVHIGPCYEGGYTEAKKTARIEKLATWLRLGLLRLGREVQAEPKKPMLRAPGPKRLKL